MGITFDPGKLKVVPITEVRPNDWNPKKPDTPEAAKIQASVRENGQRIPIVVREFEGRDDEGRVTLYQIIDGEQRFNACVALGFQSIMIYDEGIMEDDAAKALTVWYQQQVPFDHVLEAELIAAIAHMPLPYTPEEIAEMQNLTSFDWTQVQPDEQEEVEFRTFTVRLPLEAYQVVIQAVEKVQDEQQVPVARALELVCADFLAGTDAYLEASEEQG